MTSFTNLKGVVTIFSEVTSGKRQNKKGKITCDNIIITCQSVGVTVSYTIIQKFVLVA